MITIKQALLFSTGTPPLVKILSIHISNIATNPLKAKGQINEDAFKSYGSVLQHTTKLKSINAKFISGVSVDFSPATYFAQFHRY